MDGRYPVWFMPVLASVAIGLSSCRNLRPSVRTLAVATIPRWLGQLLWSWSAIAMVTIRLCLVLLRQIGEKSEGARLAKMAQASMWCKTTSRPRHLSDARRSLFDSQFWFNKSILVAWEDLDYHCPNMQIGKRSVNLRKFSTPHKSHIREHSLFTGITANQIRSNARVRLFCLFVPDENLWMKPMRWLDATMESLVTVVNRWSKSRTDRLKYSAFHL